MKRLIILVLIVFLATPAFAEIKETQKNQIYNQPGTSYKTTAIREHTHPYEDTYLSNTDNQRTGAEAGVGVDLLLFKFGENAKNLKKVKLELKKDLIDMDRMSGYLVAEVDVSSVFAFLQ